jgi:PAS domain S-box-containing protein
MIHLIHSKIINRYPAMYHILYVDDDPGLLEIGKIFLESDWAFTVDTSESALETLRILESIQFDAIISDYQMPGMDGITFLKTLRASGNTTPFIIFTGKGREDVVIEALNSGADFYVQKGGEPVSQFAELAHKLLHAISRKRADMALKKSEHDYRHLIEHAGEAIFIIQDKLFRLINTQAMTLSGYSEEELLKQPFSRFVHPDDVDPLLDAFTKRSTGSNVPSHYTFRIIRKDTTIRWVELNVVAITWDEHPAILNFMTDITPRKQAEDALRESEERYRQFFKTTLDSVFITTPEGRYIDFNDALMETLGYKSREETFGIDVASTYAHPEEREEFLKYVEKEGWVKEYPLQFRKRDGTAIDSLISIVSLKNPDGSLKAFIGTVRDITGRKHAEDTLRENEERYRHIFESFEDLYYQTDTKGIITILSPSLHYLTEWGEKELIGKPVTSIYVNPDDRRDLLDEIAKNGHVRDYEVLLLKRDGTHVPVSLSANRICHADGTLAGVAGILRDITRRKLAEDSLKESEEKFRTLVECSFDGILIIDFNGKILFSNNAAATLADTDSCAGLSGRSLMDFIAPESRQAFSTDFEEGKKSHKEFLARHYFITSAGRKKFIENRSKVITYKGMPAGLITLRDISVTEEH